MGKKKEKNKEAERRKMKATAEEENNVDSYCSLNRRAESMCGKLKLPTKVTKPTN